MLYTENWPYLPRLWGLETVGKAAPDTGKGNFVDRRKTQGPEKKDDRNILG